MPSPLPDYKDVLDVAYSMELLAAAAGARPIISPSLLAMAKARQAAAEGRGYRPEPPRGPRGWYCR